MICACVCVCFLLQQSPQRASFSGQSEWGGRMVPTGYVRHDFVVVHHRHCKKHTRNKESSNKQNKSETTQVSCMSSHMANTHREWAGETGNGSVTLQTSPTGLKMEDEPPTKAPLCLGYIYRSAVYKHCAEQVWDYLTWNLDSPSHFSDSRCSLFHFLSHTLLRKKKYIYVV